MLTDFCDYCAKHGFANPQMITNRSVWSCQLLQVNSNMLLDHYCFSRLVVLVLKDLSDSFAHLQGSCFPQTKVVGLLLIECFHHNIVPALCALVMRVGRWCFCYEREHQLGACLHICVVLISSWCACNSKPPLLSLGKLTP